MSETSDFTIEVRDRDFVRVGQIAPEYTDIKFVDVHNGVGAWELKLPNEHPLLPALTAKGAGIVVTEHWMEGEAHKYRVYSGRVRSPRLSQDAADPAGTWVISGVDDNVIGAATRVYPDPASASTAQAVGYWEQAGKGETVMKLAVQLNAGSTALPARRYPWLAVAADSLRGGTVKCSSRFDVLGDLLTSLGTTAGLGWEFRQVGASVVFDVYEPQDKRGEVRLDIRNGGLQSNELGWTAPSASEVLVLGQGEGAERTVLPVTSTEAAAEAVAWGLRWEVVKDQRNTDDPAELLQAGEEILADQGATVNSLKVVPSDAPGMRLGRDWYRGDQITVVIDGQETSAIVTQVATSISSAGVIRQVTVGDPVGFSFDAKIASKVKSVEQRVGQVERLIDQVISPARVSPLGAVVTDWNSATEVGFYQGLAGAANAPFATHPFMGVVSYRAGGVVEQRLSVGVEDVTNEWVRQFNGASWTKWRRTDNLMVATGGTGWNYDPVSGRYNLFTITTDFTFDGVFTPAFRQYRILYQVYSNTAHQNRFRLRSAGVDESGLNYFWGVVRSGGTNSSVDSITRDGRSNDGNWVPTQFDSNQHHGEFYVSEPMFTAGGNVQKRARGYDYAQNGSQSIWGGHMNNRDTTPFDGFHFWNTPSAFPTAQAFNWISIEGIA
ncbi:minor tail protein [Microbacterium phage Sharkboy]|uniref:Minor tail protein n=1 Tax=Microbacterium phage Sharkboy TaxID=2590938 RepID=A0A516KU97_9CAUD|nr:minor tail protein [Microbacterium phage Sharkboy]